MTSTESIRSALADLWDAGACAYELAQAVINAADIESADLELEVESVISRALLAREFVDLSKVAEGVAKVLPDAPASAKPLPLCEAILAEVDEARRTGRRPRAWMRVDDAQAIICKHFAALTEDQLAMAIAPDWFSAKIVYPGPGDVEIKRKRAIKGAQAVLRLLRRR